MKPTFLIFELHHLGDAVMAFPFLKTAAAQGSVTVYCTASVSTMLKTFLPEVETVVAAATWTGRYWQAQTKLRKLHPHAALSAWSDVRVQILGWLSSAPVRAGLPMNEKNYYAAETSSRGLRLRLGRLVEHLSRALGVRLLTLPVERTGIHASHAKNWLLLADILHLPVSLATPWFDAGRFALPSSLQGFLQTQHAAGRALWVIHPGGRLPAKRWPRERFQQLLAGYFQETGEAVIIIHEPDDDSPSPVGDRQKAFSCTSHADLAAVLNAADFVLTNDSYPAHLAAALGKKTFTIFGSGDPAIFAPQGNHSRVIRQEGCPRHSGAHRSLTPCLNCLEAVSVKDVETALSQRGVPDDSISDF